MQQQTPDKIQLGCEDLKLLLDRGYPKEYALWFIGDHHGLTTAERNLVMRQAYSEQEISSTQAKLKPISYLAGRHFVIDGFNVIITLEQALFTGGAFKCMDGLIRDNAMAFSNYKITDNTRKTVDEVIDLLAESKPKDVTWVFDSQLSGSGSLSQYVMRRQREAGIPGESMTSPTADHQIYRLNLLTATSDSALIKRLNEIIDLPAAVLDKKQEHSAEK